MSDDGFTTLPAGLRLGKSDVLFDALGALDELNAALGLLRAACAGSAEAILLETIQADLLRIGGELATGQPQLDPAAPARLDREIARRGADRPPPADFVRPGANEREARAHWARATCRRAERELVRAHERHPQRVFPPALAHLNRLSAFLFAFAAGAAGQAPTT